MRNELENNLRRQLVRVLEMLEHKYLLEPTEMLEQIIKRYRHALHLINTHSINDLSLKDLKIKGSTRAYLEAYTDYLNPMLEEMDKAEKLGEQL